MVYYPITDLSIDQRRYPLGIQSPDKFRVKHFQWESAEKSRRLPFYIQSRNATWRSRKVSDLTIRPRWHWHSHISKILLNQGVPCTIVNILCECERAPCEGASLTFSLHPCRSLQARVAGGIPEGCVTPHQKVVHSHSSFLRVKLWIGIGSPGPHGGCSMVEILLIFDLGPLLREEDTSRVLSCSFSISRTLE